MYTHPDEYFPEDNLLQLVIRESLQPTLAEYEEQVGSPLPLALSVWAGHESHPPIIITATQILEDTSATLGELHLRFRTTIRQSRVLYSSESIFTADIAPGTGYSGFQVTGEILGVPDNPQVKGRSHVVRYNVREWRGWFW